VTQNLPTELATFIINKQRRTIDVMLGPHRVAYINTYGRQVRYSVLLPNAGTIRVTDSLPTARRCVLHVLSEWFERAGPAFAKIAETLATQGELEREAA